MLKSRANRFVWAVNGYLLLALISMTLVQEYQRTGFPWSQRQPHERGIIVGQTAEISRALNIDVQHLEYDTPSRVGTSSFFASSVYVMDKNMPREVRDAIASAGDISPSLIGARINILFFDEHEQRVNRLLSSNGYIDLADFPHSRRSQDGADGSARQFILYRVATRDTNNDGRINDADEMAYYTSDLSGTQLRQITPEGLNLDYHWFSEDFTKIYFEEVEAEPGEIVPGTDYALRHRRIYVYDVGTDHFGSFDALQEEFLRLQAEFREG